MTEIAGTPAAIAAAQRLARNGGQIRAALDSLELGFNLDDVASYGAVTGAAANLLAVAGDRERFRARLAGILSGAIILGVEAERTRNLTTTEILPS